MCWRLSPCCAFPEALVKAASHAKHADDFKVEATCQEQYLNRGLKLDGEAGLWVLAFFFLNIIIVFILKTSNIIDMKASLLLCFRHVISLQVVVKQFLLIVLFIKHDLNKRGMPLIYPEKHQYFASDLDVGLPKGCVNLI